MANIFQFAGPLVLQICVKTNLYEDKSVRRQICTKTDGGMGTLIIKL